MLELSDNPFILGDKAKSYILFSFDPELGEWIKGGHASVRLYKRKRTRKKFLYFKWIETSNVLLYSRKEANLRAKKKILKKASDLYKKHEGDKKVIIVCETFSHYVEKYDWFEVYFKDYRIWEDGNWIEPKLLRERYVGKSFLRPSF